MATTTLLGLSGPGFDLSDYALRGLTASIEPIEQAAQVVRDVNGNLLDLSLAQFKKYKVTIICTDHESPGFAALSSDGDGIWPGSLVTVTLIPKLGSLTALTLNMMVSRQWTESRDEYQAETSWQLELEEV